MSKLVFNYVAGGDFHDLLRELLPLLLRVLRLQVYHHT